MAVVKEIPKYFQGVDAEVQAVAGVISAETQMAGPVGDHLVKFMEFRKFGEMWLSFYIHSLNFQASNRKDVSRIQLFPERTYALRARSDISGFTS